MTKIADLPEFDMAEWLPDEAAVAEVLGTRLVSVADRRTSPTARPNSAATIWRTLV